MRLLANELNAKATEIERQENVEVTVFDRAGSASARNKN